MRGGIFVGSAAAAATPYRAARIVEQRDLARIVLFVALCAIASIPVAIAPIPAMVDYVNHLARMYEIAAQGTPQASPFYHVAWKFYPNLAMDLIVPQMGRWLGIETATRLFLVVSQILVVTGSVAIELAVKRRFAISGFVALLYLYNVPFAWGFLNFEFALGVALWGIAAWLATRDRPWATRYAVHALFVATLFAAHLFALGLYGATLGLHEAWLAHRDTRPLRRAAAAMLLLGAPVLALAILMRASGGSVGGSVNEWQAIGKPIWPLLLLNGDNAPVSILGTLLLACLGHAMMRRREIAFVASGAWLATGFLVLYLAIPGRLLDTAFVDIRVLVGAVLILPAFVEVSFGDARDARRAAMLVAGVTIVNVSCVAWVWSSYQPIYRDMIASFARLTPHARVLAGHGGAADDPPLMDLAAYPLYHAPTLAVHYAGAFVPTLFTSAGKQPLEIAGGLERLSYSNGGPVPLETLRKASGPNRGPHSAVPRFLADWRRDFDFVYLLGAAPNDPMPGALELVERHPSFALYRVVPPAGGATLSAPASP